MRVVHVVSTLDPAAGGPSQVALRLAAAQSALGHEIHILFYSTPADRERTEREIERVPFHDRIQFHPLLDPGRVEYLLARRARHMVGALTPTSDFIHIHGVWGSILKAAAEVAFGRGVPYCFQPHGMLDPWSLGQKRWKKRIGLAVGYGAALRRSSFIHALNGDEARLIKPLNLGERTVIIPNGFFFEEISPLPQMGTFRAAHPELGSQPYILFLARLHPKKGLDILADAFSLLARQREDVRLVVAGPDGGARADFEARVASADVTDRVHVVGALYGRDKFAALVDAACFCLPSRQEGFSVAITEAMACAVPVVISEACHFPEVSDAKAGIVVPLRVDALVAALGEILASHSDAARMGAAGVALVKSRYTWDVVARQTISQYREVLR